MTERLKAPALLAKVKVMYLKILVFYGRHERYGDLL
jgi:hypothetical protein